MNYFFAILILIALFSIIRGIDYIIRLVTKGKKYYQFHLRWFPSFELAIWILFVFWLLRNLLSEEIYYPFLVVAITILLVLAIGWYVFRDLVSGVILKAGHAMETGMIVKSEAASGVISSLGYLGLELNTPEGETLRIPYSQIIGKGITCQEKSSQLRRQKLSLVVPQKHGVQNIQQKLRKKLLELPWIIAGEEIEITVKPRDDCYIADISFRSLYADMLLKTGEIMRKYVDDTFPGC